jgi:serine/threonine protein kinase
VHEAGLVHRDFKPSNVIVRGDGTVQVLDFGLAAEAGEKIEEGDTDGPHARPHLDALAATLTETGGIMGTPAYMAPEQFLGLGADARSDQFSFCVSLYEALHGERPFKGRDLPELMMAVVEGLLDLPPELPGVPDLLQRSLARGLHRDPNARFPDLEALLYALERCRAPAPVAQSGGWRRFALGMVAGGGVLAVGVSAWISAWPDEQTLDPEPEVLMITAPMGEVPDAVVPTPIADPAPSRAPPVRQADEAPGAEEPIVLPGVEDLGEARAKRTPVGDVSRDTGAPSGGNPRKQGDTASADANLPGPVASSVASDPSAPEPPSPVEPSATSTKSPEPSSVVEPEEDDENDASEDAQPPTSVPADLDSPPVEVDLPPPP